VAPSHGSSPESCKPRARASPRVPSPCRRRFSERKLPDDGPASPMSKPSHQSG
jgi:hypothetical protein